jgi:hypothetical protein
MIGRGDQEAHGPPARVWYVAYGSNLSQQRLRCYLRGGRPVGSVHRNPGARDPRPPSAVRTVAIDRPAYFGGASRVWSGGVAFLDHGPAAGRPTLGRGYLITVEQFADVLAQEGRRPVGGPLDPRIAASLADGARRSLGTGWYDTVVPLGPLDGHPAVTFTAAWLRSEVAEMMPSPAYLSVVGAGLREAWGLTAAEAAAYLSARLPAATGVSPSG